MGDVAILNVDLHGKLIGTLTRLPDDRNLFAFATDYIEDETRDTLSLSFKDIYGGLDAETRPTQTKAPPFFANLLPEGSLRGYLAARARVSEARDFFLLWVLGADLPGAVTLSPADGESWPEESARSGADVKAAKTAALRFSLAGVQLKFSAVKNAAGGLTVPANGMGGSWIVKLPSAQHKSVPENEFAMMELARRVGIDVPETKLMALSEIAGLPSDVASLGTHAFVIKRFDRVENGVRVHIEDFAQVFGLPPSRKYERANNEMIARVLAAETSDSDVAEFVRRLVFNALTGNGDMHLKNWSLIYPDKRKAALAPAYDFVATIEYIKPDRLALNFADTKDFTELDRARFARFAAKAKLSANLVMDTLLQTVERFHTAWSRRKDLPISKALEAAINAHLKALPIAHE